MSQSLPLAQSGPDLDAYTYEVLRASFRGFKDGKLTLDVTL